MIKAVAEFIKNNPKSKILLVGHTDFIGSEALNTGLSGRRANSVKAALIKMGVKEARVQTKGEGSKYPLASNDQEREGR